jgi:hypothetical protein
MKVYLVYARLSHDIVKCFFFSVAFPYYRITLSKRSNLRERYISNRPPLQQIAKYNG